MKPIDLRSDTVTLPSEGMRQAMARAEVGDDVYGEDPTVNALEARVAELLGKEAALYLPTGTMANQLAVGLLARGGDEILCEQGSHLLGFEGGAISALWGVQPRGLAGERGIFGPAAVEGALRAENDHYPRTRAVAIENTHNRGGGAIWPLPAVRALCELAARRGLALHMDGARLLNAVVASGVSARDYASGCTTVSLCLSKGLGAPAGSLLAGARDLIREGRRLRKRLGGGMRQAGILAAAGLYALDHNVDRLREDHESARLLAQKLGEVPGVEIPFPADTNLVFAAFRGRVAADLVARFRAAGVLCNPEGSRPDLVRFVTHLDAPTARVEEAAGRMIAVLRA